MEKKMKISKWLLYTFLMLASILTGTSCITDNDDLPDCPPAAPKNAPVVTAGLYCNNKLIAWEDESTIGVYLIDNEKECLLQDSLGVAHILNDAEKGLFLPQWGVGDQVLKRPELGVMYDAIGIYPYGVSLKDTKSVSLCVSDQSHPEKLDLFIPRRIHGITADTDTLHLDFYRRMSRLIFNLKLTEVKDGEAEVEADEKLAGASIQVNGLPVDGTFLLENGKLETGDAQSFQAYVTDNGKQGQAIVFPSSSTKDVRFQVSLPQCPDTLYSFVLDKDMVLEACHSHILNLDMKHIYKPQVKQYNVKYRYEGGANKENVTVTRGTSQLPWGEGDIIKVNENGSFTFIYTSALKVSVRTEDSEALPMTSGQAYTFSRINKDVTVIIYTEESKPDPEPEKTYKVTYRYAGEANSNNVKVYKDGMSTAWAQTETITVKENEDFTFGFNSSMVVSVKTKEGETLSMNSGTPYTFKKVNKDIEIIISAETPEYAVKYIFQGTYTKDHVTVNKGNNLSDAWSENKVVYVTEGGDFTFKPSSDYTVTVKVKDKELPKNTNGSYTVKSIYEDVTIFISTNIHKVTYQYTAGTSEDNVSVYKGGSLSESWSKETAIWVDDNTDFTFKTKSEHEVVVTSNGGTLSPTQSLPKGENTFKIKDITDDIIIYIGAETKENIFEHDVIYTFQGDASGNTTVEIGNAPWHISDVKTVNDGDSFSFTATSQYTLKITAALTNDPGTNVDVIKSGDTYTISNIKKNVTISISATIHNVRFDYDGNYVNEATVPITKGIAPSSSWSPEESGIVKVDDDKSFTFTNNSDFSISVSGYGGTFTVASKTPYTINNIKDNITLTITASICKVTYQFDNASTDKVSTWVNVKQNGSSWTAGEDNAKYIATGDNFSFDCSIASGTTGRIVYVQENNTDVSSSSNTYTISNIQSDKEIHIKAVKTYTVYYKFADGTTKPSDFKIWKETLSSTNKEEWTTAGESGKVTLDAGSNFSFSINKTFNVTINGAEKTLPNNQYTIEKIQEDQVIVLDASSKLYVTIVDNTGQFDVTYSEHSDYVTSGNGFTITPTLPDNLKTKYTINVTANKTGSSTTVAVTDNADGSYTVSGVTENIDINISVIRKAADATITATIQDWTELKTENGGSMYPD